MNYICRNAGQRVIEVIITPSPIKADHNCGHVNKPALLYLAIAIDLTAHSSEYNQNYCIGHNLGEPRVRTEFIPSMLYTARNTLLVFRNCAESCEIGFGVPSVITQKRPIFIAISDVGLYCDKS